MCRVGVVVSMHAMIDMQFVSITYELNNTGAGYCGFWYIFVSQRLLRWIDEMKVW